MTAAITVLAFVVWLALPTINVLKGKWWFALFSLVGGFAGIGFILGVVGGIRLAKPRSYWPGSYDSAKKAKSIERHGQEGGGFPGAAREVTPRP
jgi:hypothetical protein